MSGPRLSIVVPAHNSARTLGRCLDAIRRTSVPCQLIVVDDGSSDASGRLATEHGALVVRHERAAGPARARNAGIARSDAPIILFVDADVAIADDAVNRVVDTFERDPSLGALFGSYDDDPDARTLLSDYRNLLHHYVHQQARPEAKTFWAGLGAARRDVLTAQGGFDERYARPSIEDIELGSRLAAAGCRIRIDRDLQGTHLKQWTFSSMLRADILDRARPWTQLMLRRARWPTT
ncbi:MAG: glycosyltransferase family A protein [Vicinamibacterales bacterium]